MTLRRGDGTGSLEKAIDVLEEIGNQPGGISQSDLAARLDLPRTTVYRLLATLVARGLARHDPSRRIYHLGVRYVELARRAYAMPDLVAAAMHELRELRDLTGETSYIGTLEGTAMVSLERCDGAHSYRSNASLGHRKPIHATSQGKAYLAALGQEARDALVSELNLNQLTPQTLTNRRRLYAEIRTIRARGWAIDDEENVPGVRCVGAAVIDLQGNVRGAISVAGPAYRLPISRIELLGPELVEAAHHIGARLQGLDEGSEVKEAIAVPSDGALFGAFPQWCESRQSLWWVDTLAPAVRRLAGGMDQPFTRIDHPIIGFCVRDEIGYAVCSDEAFRITPDGIAHPLEGWRAMPAAAMCVHPNGEFWAVLAGQQDRSVIGTFDEQGGFRRRWHIDEPVQDIVWSPCGQRLYAVAPDSGSVLMLQAGTDRVRRLTSVPRGSGILSGIAIDPQGGVWSALRGGWSVIRLGEDGAFDRSVPLPVPYPTGVVIGGASLDKLYVTTARQPVAPEMLKAAPLSGRLFEIAL